ncbi:MAG0110 family membrane protein [[Mycoplasma] gypis]|uniref:Inhibitor of apoptosis-promoting Bax1 n=1 Tax=[Mycoplasma] gypis TaxID=92404 RepID=A0ABZ2RTT2_9BACT|nr:hypothetical protein [[Mycoplasma] gypis]MBN0919335.1 hypothetical protein [[Mycoplasma] gypis]
MYDYDSDFNNVSYNVQKTEKSLIFNKLLGLSVFWFGLGAMFCFVIAGLLPLSKALMAKFLAFDPSTLFIIFIVAVVSQIIISFILSMLMPLKGPRKLNPIVHSVMYGFYIVVSTITLTFFTFSLQAYTNLNINQVMLAFLIPLLAIAIIGILAYTGVIKFEKYLWVGSILFFASLIFMIILMFTTFRDYKLYSIYATLFVLASLIFIGVQFRQIKSYSDNIQQLDNREILNLSIYFGFSLYVYYYSLVMELLRLFSILKD